MCLEITERSEHTPPAPSAQLRFDRSPSASPTKSKSLLPGGLQQTPPPPHEICACKSGHVIPPLKPSHSFPTPLTERNALQDRRPGATRPARPSSSSCPSLPLSQNTGRLPSPVPQPGGVSGSGLAVSLTSFPALLPRYLLREASPISEATFQSHVLHNSPSEHLALPDTTLHNYGFTTVLTNSIWGEALKKRQCSRPHPKQ